MNETYFPLWDLMNTENIDVLQSSAIYFENNIRILVYST